MTVTGNEPADRSRSAEIDLPAAPDGALVGYVPGAYDMFHIGHLRILLRAAEACDWLIVGVVPDDRLEAVKGHRPITPLDERVEIVEALDMVDHVVVDDSTDKIEMWHRLRFDVLFKGDDWRGTPKGDALEASMAKVGAKVHYMPYTKHTSSTRLRSLIEREHDGSLPHGAVEAVLDESGRQSSRSSADQAAYNEDGKDRL